MYKRTILKLGGSIITDKATGDGSINYDTLFKIAETISSYSDLPILIVHGAGSCGHPQAKQYRLDIGVDFKNRRGIYETHKAVANLNHAVVKAFRDAGIEAVSIHPLHGAIADNGKLTGFETEHLKAMIKVGLVPVVHGDVVMDISRGACIVSGDQLVRYLAPALDMERVGMATDVPGLLDTDGSVVREMHRITSDAIWIGKSDSVDVTGGMKGKIIELLELADAGIDSDIFHASQIDAFLKEADHKGTSIRHEVR